MMLKCLDFEVDQSLLLQSYQQVTSMQHENNRFITLTDTWKYDTTNGQFIKYSSFDVDISNKYKNTYFNVLWKSLAEKFQYVFSVCALRTMDTNVSLEWHRDRCDRVHIPIITNEHSYFIDEHFVCHNLKAATGYYLPTMAPHSYVNGNIAPRTHLIFSII